MRIKNSSVAVGEWNWEGAPENPTREERIKYFMELDNGRRRLYTMLGLRDWKDLEDLVGYDPWIDPHFSITGPDSLDDWTLGLILELLMPKIEVSGPAAQITSSILTAYREAYTVISSPYSNIFATRVTAANTLFDFERDTLYVRHNSEHNKREEAFGFMLEPLLCKTDVDSFPKLRHLAFLPCSHE